MERWTKPKNELLLLVALDGVDAPVVVVRLTSRNRPTDDARGRIAVVTAFAVDMAISMAMSILLELLLVALCLGGLRLVIMLFVELGAKAVSNILASIGLLVNQSRRWIEWEQFL